MPAQPMMDLNDGRSMPQLGLGTWRAAAGEAAAIVRAAIAAGYRLIDTASMYGNEPGVGEGVRGSGVAREELFVTTKLASAAHGHDAALKAFDESAKRLGLERVDLYLIHWPAPRQGLYLEAWKALVRLQAEGRVTSIGVSNFTAEHLRRVIGETGVTPAVNQVELHPRFQQRELRELHGELGIVTESWSPLGQGGLLADPTVKRIAAKHGKTPAQTILRWHLDCGLVAIPKSSNSGRIAENFDVFDFYLDGEDMAAMAGLDDPRGRIGPHPDTFG